MNKDWSTLKKLIWLRGKPTMPPEPDYSGCWIEFSAPQSFTLSVTEKLWSGKVEYSYDGNEWTTWDGTEISGTKIYLRGVLAGGLFGSQFVSLGDNISCSGNIENLLNYKKVAIGEHPVMGKWAFWDAFSGVTGLISAPSLPATTLAEGCYGSMFAGCVGLRTAPRLPATTLANRCYDSMFSQCVMLTSAPELPATTLAEGCYNRMFEFCERLTVPPILPATNLASNCYYQMFQNSGLITAPALPATTLAFSCYSYMFYGCESLLTPPELPATTLAGRCYANMFDGCYALTKCVNIPALNLENGCCSMMFHRVPFTLSTTQNQTYPYAWRIPSSGTPTVTGTNWNYLMFNGGTRSPTEATTYYLNVPSI